MARSSDINQRITLSGADEVRRHLEEIGKAGERAGSQTRAALLAATQGAGNFTAGARSASASSGQMRFALQNLTFQVNDVATSLASGGDVMRVFAQQGGQIFQVFQQGGGFGAVMGGAASAIRGMITPMTAAVAGLAAVGAAFAALVARAASAEGSARQFDVILKAQGKSSQVSGKELENLASKFRDVGISTEEARKIFGDFLKGAGNPKQLEQITRIAGNVQAAFGTDAMNQFVAAAAKGGEPLRAFAEQLGIIPKVADDTVKGLDTAAKSAAAFKQKITDVVQRGFKSAEDEQKTFNQRAADLNRQRAEQDKASGIALQIQRDDLTRKRGTAEQELELANNRRSAELKRQRAAEDEQIQIEQQRREAELRRQQADAINEALRQRNQQNAEALAAYNQQITESAQKALETGQGLLNQIDKALSGAHQSSLSPFQQAIADLSQEWKNMLDTISKSETFTQIIKDLGDMARSISDTIKWVDKLVEAIKKVPGLSGGGEGPTKTLWGGPVGFAAGTSATPPGTILVGERGPELISQPGGLSVWPHQQTERLLSAFRALNMPAMPRSRRFATGTIGNALPAGGGSRTPINLHIGGETFGLEADDATAQRVIRFARKRALLSAGRKPSTA